MREHLNLVLVVVTGVITLWRLVVVLRSPRPTPGRVTALVVFACAFASNAFGYPLVADAVDAVAPGLANLLTNVVLLAFFAGFVYFFGSEVRRGRLSDVRLQVGVAGAVAVVLVAAWLVAPGGDVEYHDLHVGGPVAPFVFSLVASVYSAYACAASAWLAGRAGLDSTGAWRWAFGLCSLGMLGALVGGPVVRIPAEIALWTGNDLLPPSVGSLAQVVLTLGICGVVLGLWSVAMIGSLGRLAAWRTAKRRNDTLRPMWAELSRAFPAMVMRGTAWTRLWERVPSPAAAVAYRRKVVECRDGLWRLSPWVPDRDTADPGAQARLVQDALRRVRRDEAPTGPAGALAAPRGAHGPEDDEAALLDLARAYARRTREPAMA